MVDSFNKFRILDIAKDYLKERNIDTKQLETDNAGGMCWWFARDFSKYLTKLGKQNMIVNMTGEKGNGNHMVVKVGEDFIDFTFNQFDDDTVPVIKKKSDYYKYYDNFEEYNSFSDILKHWEMTEDEFEKYIIKNKLKKPIK